MAMVIAPICFSNVGSIERGRISPESTYSIDKVIVKMSDGKRKTRYAVCVDHCWKSNQQMTLREAREEVSRMQDDFLTKGTAVVGKVTDRTFPMVSDLASYASELEAVGLKRQGERLRRIAGEIENASHAILEVVKK
jgi:hypothetical protein